MMPATSLVHNIDLTWDVESKLSFASLNVQYLPTTLPAVLELLGDAKCDIVGLQEVNMHVGSKATVRAMVRAMVRAWPEGQPARVRPGVAVRVGVRVGLRSQARGKRAA